MTTPLTDDELALARSLTMRIRQTHPWHREATAVLNGYRKIGVASTNDDASDIVNMRRLFPGVVEELHRLRAEVGAVDSALNDAAIIRATGQRGDLTPAQRVECLRWERDQATAERDRLRAEVERLRLLWGCAIDEVQRG